MRETITEGYHPITPSSAHSSSANLNADLSSLLKFREQTAIALGKALTTVRNIKSYSGKETIEQILTRKSQILSSGAAAVRGAGEIIWPEEKALPHRKKRNLKEKLISGPIIAAVIFTGVGTGVGLTVYEHLTSEKVSTVDSLTYPSIKKGTIKAEDIVRIPQEQIDALFPDAFGKINDGHNTLLLQYPLDLSSSTKPNVNIHFKKSFREEYLVGLEIFKNKGYYDQFEFNNVPKGSTIPSPVDGYVNIAIDPAHPLEPNGGDSCNILMHFKSENGKDYNIIFFGTGHDNDGNETVNIFTNIINAPAYNSKQDRLKSVGEYGKFVKKGEPISQLTCDSNFGFTVTEKITAGEPYLPSNIEFLTDSDGKTIQRANNP